MTRAESIKLLASVPLANSAMNLSDLERLSSDFGKSERMPILFLGHGSPMNAIEENEFVAGFRNTAKTLPKPKAILCISAHWFTNGTMVTAMSNPRTIHDFGGFPQALFDVQYPAPGSPQLAKTAQTLLAPTPVKLDESWGLDHGAWSVIKHLYPKADVPVIQMSIDYTKPPIYHFELAQRLAALRDKGILIIGSGNIIHNLGRVDFANMHRDNYGYDWAIEARSDFNRYILDDNYKPLINYYNQSEAFRLSIPTPDHYLPLLYILGLKQKTETTSLFNDKLLAGSLSMTSLKIS